MLTLSRKLIATDGKKLGVLLAAMFALAVWVARRTLRYPWFWDDYHLVRRFTSSELAGAFVGPWDVDHIEANSYRPLMLLVNHARAFAFGEDLLMHRLFLLLCLALFTSLILLCAHRCGLRLRYAIAAGALAVMAKSSHANLMWVTDATHALSGIPVALCCVIRSSSRPRLGAAEPFVIAVLALTGLMIREDIAALFPFVIVAGLFRRDLSPEEGATQGSWLRRVLVVHGPPAAALLVSTAGYFLLRSLFVPDAVTGFELGGMLSHLSMTLTVMGTMVPVATRVAWYLFVVLLVGVALFATGAEPNRRVQLVLWLGCVVLACTPGLATERSNLLMVPTTLFACSLALAAQMVIEWQRDRRLGAIIVVAAVSFGALTLSETDKVLLSGHPQSAQAIAYTADFLYGQYASQATIPPQRRARAEAYLSEVGIDSAERYPAALRALIGDAARRGQTTPGNGLPFLPESPFLSH